MQKSLEPEKLDKVQLLYKRNREAKRFFDWAANQLNDIPETPVEDVSQKLFLEYVAVRELFKKFDKIGLGRMIVGRRKFPTRLVWDYRLQDVGQQAKEVRIQLNADKFDIKEISEAGDLVKLVDHLYNLRPELTIKLSLPPDLTEKEAERIGKFVESLPFE